MKGGKKRRTNLHTVKQSAPRPSDSTSDVKSVNGGGDVLGEERRKSEKLEATKEATVEEEGEGGEEQSEAEKVYGQLEDVQIGEAEETEGERTKLAEGYYEIEAVRRKRVRKGKLQYLIKWRGWSEAENTWEPLGNLLQCSDIIDAFEESLKAGKSRSTRRRKRKTGITHVQTKKKHHQQQQRSPAAATYSVPSHMIRIAEEPISSPLLKDLSRRNPSGDAIVNGTKNVETSKKVNENGVKMFSVVGEEEKERSELDLKLCELKGATMISKEDAGRFVLTSQEVQPTGRDTLENGLSKTGGVNPMLLGRCTGAKRRKSGSVKRFKKDPTLCSVDDLPNEDSSCASLVPVSVQYLDFLGNETNCKNKYEDSKGMCTITQIVKPISYKASTSNNIQEVVLTFDAVRLSTSSCMRHDSFFRLDEFHGGCRSDGTKVTVDNKFLKANNPLLLIDFYEKHLRYHPS